MQYPTLHLVPSLQTDLLNKINDLFAQIEQYIETNEAHFKTQMDEVFVQYWEEIKTTAKELYLTLALDNYMDYIESCDEFHEEELSDVMYEALVDETPFELFHQLKHLKKVVAIEGDLYDEIIAELEEMQTNKTAILAKDVSYELEKRLALFGYELQFRDKIFESEDELYTYEPEPNDAYILFKSAEDEIEGVHYLDGYYF